MTTTTFVNGQTPIVADWLNDVNAHIYDEVAHAHNSDNIDFTQVGTGAVTRNAQDKMRESVSVLDFGAVGDGITDDTAAIQAAINANPFGAVFLVANEIYLITAQLLINNSCSLYGLGKAVIRLKDGANIGSTYDCKMLWVKDSNHVVIDGIVFDENMRGGTTCNGAIHVSSTSNIRITNNTVYDNNNVGITIAGSGGSAGQCEWVLISGNTIMPLTPGTNQEGIKTSGNRKVTISNNHIKTLFDDGISVNGYYVVDPSGYDDGDRDIVIENNICECWSRSIVLDGWVENVVVTGNTCRKVSGSNLAQPLILVTNVISGSIATSYARNVTITNNALEVNTDYSVDCSGIVVTSGVGIVVSNNVIRKDGLALPTSNAIDISCSGYVKTLQSVSVTGNNILNYLQGVYIAASGADYPIDITVDGNALNNVTYPVSTIGAASADKNWVITNNSTNSSGGINNISGLPVVREFGNTWNKQASFSAWVQFTTSISASTWTKLLFDTEEWDTASFYDSSTNHRFQPTEAGYYQISAGAAISSTPTGITLSLYKNGANYKMLANTSSNAIKVSGSALVYLNGSTDYVEAYVYIGATQNIGAGIPDTYFQGGYLRK